MLRVRGDETLGSRHERGDGGLHVGRAAPKELAVADGGLERIGGPLLARTGRHDIRVTRKHDERPPGTVADEEVRHVAALDDLGLEAQRNQAVDDELIRHGDAGRHASRSTLRRASSTPDEQVSSHSTPGDRRAARRRASSATARACRSSWSGGRTSTPRHRWPRCSRATLRHWPTRSSTVSRCARAACWHGGKSSCAPIRPSSPPRASRARP